ncbi:MAG TPA: GAF domain-containing protein, partial [Verrucomicrobiae bacterium]|nr:GAF domain-containing protein [Verrucomicrobiae bacterium]
MKKSVPPGEKKRLKVLWQYDVLDTVPEEVFDDLTELAARICEAPIALITLVDENRQWFKSKVGISLTETSRDISFCGHAIQQSDLFIVPDATKDKRFAENPLVVSDPRIRFYA